MRKKSVPAASTDSVATVKRPKKNFEFHAVHPEELAEDGTLLCRLTIPGNSTTKKTHQRIIYVKGHPRIIQSEQYLKYEVTCKPYCEAAWKDTGHAPMDFGIAIIFQIFLDRWQLPDATGVMQALGDIIQKWGIIADDAWIHWGDSGEHWFGGVDKINPRVEMTVVRYRHPKEIFRLEQEEAETGRLARKEAREEKAADKAREAIAKATQVSDKPRQKAPSPLQVHESDDMDEVFKLSGVILADDVILTEDL